MRTLDVLMYFALTISATAAGICYAMAIDTMQRKGYRWIWTFVFSILITPFGAWIISLALREAPPPEHAVQPSPEEEQPKV